MVINNRCLAVVTAQMLICIKFMFRNLRLYCWVTLNLGLHLLLQAFLPVDLLEHRKSHRQKVMKVPNLLSVVCFLHPDLHLSIPTQTCLATATPTTKWASLLNIFF
jgi:hypothetical protein